MINLSQTLNYIKARLGASVHKLELSDQEILRCIQEETMYTMSEFFPEKKIHRIYPHELVDDHEGTYFLRGLEDRVVLGVSKLLENNSATHNVGTGSSFYDHSLPIHNIESFMMTKAVVNVSSALSFPYTYEFKPPNKVLIQPHIRTPFVDLELKLVHANPSTFHPGLRKYFNKLALYDVQLDLLGIRKYFQSISSSYGEINLRMEDLEQADQSREELIELFAQKQIYSPNRQKIWVA